MLLDEPLSNVDQSFKEEIQVQLKKLLHDLKITTIIVTHDSYEAFYLGSKCGVILKDQLNNFHLTFVFIVASTCVLLQTHGSNVLTLCRFSCIRLEFSGSRTYWIKAMSSYRTQKVLPQKRYNPAEEWDYLEEDTLKHTRSASVCMTCQHFNYCCDRHCRTILTCHLHQRLIPHGEHLTSKCQCWMQRLERKIGWCPEAA